MFAIYSAFSIVGLIAIIAILALGIRAYKKRQSVKASVQTKVQLEEEFTKTQSRAKER